MPCSEKREKRICLVLYSENEGICLVLIFAINLALCGKEE